ncbi:MAG: thioredoxin fold domain-containing protein [Pseudomonadota bacterium]
MKRLYKLLAFLAASLWLAITTLHAEVTVPVATDLQRDGNQALSRELPILLTFTSMICSYCEQLEQDFLQPMLLGGEYRDKVIIRKLEVDYGNTVTGFNGQRVTGSELSDRYRVFVTPTLLFVDGNGKELAERMVGINTPELFGGYLDACIETALLQIRNPGMAASISGCQLEHAANSDTIFRTAVP